MTVQSEVSKISYAGNGVTTFFSTGFIFDQKEDVKVIVVNNLNVEILQNVGTNYAITGGGGLIGNITMVSPPAIGEKLFIYRDPPLTQNYNYVNNDAFDAESHEKALDKLTHICQKLREQSDRAMRMPLSSSIDATLPAPQPGYFFGWNTTGTGLQNYPSVTSITTIESRSDINSLRLLEPKINGQVIIILGQTVAGTGGGLFRADLNDTTTTDNNDTVIVTSGGKRWKKTADNIIASNIRAINSGGSVVASINGTGAITGATLTASGAISGASVTASGSVSGATVTASGAVTGGSVTATTTNTDTINERTTNAGIKFNSKLSSSSGQVASTWVTFDGATLIPTILDGLNVASVTRLNTGNYLVTFTNPLPNEDYAFSVCSNAAGVGGVYFISSAVCRNITATSIEILVMGDNGSQWDGINPTKVSLIIFCKE